ncbi:hypothetical protein WMY93_003810 [Mugilogobius chulae]|uniref:Ig-like domain-containing protein n=1 Tax=Mugilogobius chulae TaxID=88201 RepID=A0AAW0Q8J4_9GOBI
MTNTSLFVQLFVGFLLSVALADSNCPIKLDPTKVVAKHGDPVSINCTAEGEHEGMGFEASENGTGTIMVNHLTWSVTSVDPSIAVLCYITPSLGNSAFKALTLFCTWVKNGQKINSSLPLSREDAGIYSVEAEGLSSREKNVSVRILYGPELSCSSNYTALEHSKFSLSCTVGVDLGNITRDDAGNYTLVASTGQQTVTQTFEVIVHYSNFILGSSVSLKCSARGNPRPKYSWIYYNTTNVSEENDDGVSILVIHNATTFNIGSYTCLASNEHGTVSKTARLTTEGAQQECPLQIIPAERMVLEYNSESKRATCTTSSTENLKEIYWRDNGGHITSGLLDIIPDTRNWDAKPAVCEAGFKGIGLCSKRLDIILYKKPDSVFIRIQRGSETLEDFIQEGEYTLNCLITSVAPAKYVWVRWFRGNESFTPQKVHVSCIECDINETRTSVNMSFSTNITVNRTHNEMTFSCEAALNLSEVQNITFPASRPLNTTVYYEPVINTTKLSSPVPVFSGYAEDLKCEAEGNPRPKITWNSSLTGPLEHSDGVLPVTQKGLYTCIATNLIGSDFHKVEVIEKGKTILLLLMLVLMNSSR